jgi:hypothetical protein
MDTTMEADGRRIALVETADIIAEALLLPPAAISYHVGRRLDALYPSRALVETDGHLFSIEPYARAGHCALKERVPPWSERSTHWRGPGKGVGTRPVQTWFEVKWQDKRLDVLVMNWTTGMGSEFISFILADSQAVAESFLAAVCAWNSELREEVLVFEGGGWHKDPELFRAIKGATLDNLVLRGTLKEDIFSDLASFFTARETYEQYGVPWKRGILLIGPPGNGKTHAVKALVNALGKPVLYVKSFRANCPDEYSIRSVFDRARMSAPCVLVLEDLDSLVTPRNRSYFLNELDGFAGNTGILTLATSNHPERLDPAIIDRPSRFDRKYPFDLPEVEERRTYIVMWNETLRPELRLSEDGIACVAEDTEGFSFAYLKELFLSATMRWISTPQPGTMDQVMPEQVEVLREQMGSAIVFGPQGDEEEEGGIPHQIMRAMSMGRGGWFGVSSFYGADEDDMDEVVELEDDEEE